jgi:hypothetical protein
VAERLEPLDPIDGDDTAGDGPEDVPDLADPTGTEPSG